ncbi:hypothetical protein FQR65_LT20016 [Abscondita terminalis]|nr:hypothetical protein FQR65_LT20016 [Abscondita terminalis]
MTPSAARKNAAHSNHPGAMPLRIRATRIAEAVARDSTKAVSHMSFHSVTENQPNMGLSAKKPSESDPLPEVPQVASRTSRVVTMSIPKPRSSGEASFSLLLPVYAGDDPAFLRLAFESSVDRQTLRPAEAVIVQDGPVPTPLVEELARIEAASPVPVSVVRLPENRGLTTALNAGLDACAYPVVARIDADDFSLPERFARQWELMEQGYDLVGTGMAEFDEDPEAPGALRVPPVGAQRIRDHARTHNPFNHPTMMYRVAALDRIGRYEPFGKMEDYWLGIPRRIWGVFPPRRLGGGPHRMAAAAGTSAHGVRDAGTVPAKCRDEGCLPAAASGREAGTVQGAHRRRVAGGSRDGEPHRCAERITREAMLRLMLRALAAAAALLVALPAAASPAYAAPAQLQVAQLQGAQVQQPERPADPSVPDPSVPDPSVPDPSVPDPPPPTDPPVPTDPATPEQQVPGTPDEVPRGPNGGVASESPGPDPSQQREPSGAERRSMAAAAAAAAGRALIGDDYPAKYRNLPWPYPSGQYIWDEWNFAYRQCTSFVAWRLNSANGVPFSNQYLGLRAWGNAAEWASAARSVGIRVDTTPEVGSVAWSGPYYGDASQFGHVAWVADVLDDGRVVIEEYNAGWAGSYTSRVLPASAFQGYIHIADLSAKFEKTSKPTISGSAMVGGTLTASLGGWSPVPTSVSYRWLRDGNVISGATGQSYQLQLDDLGRRVSVEATGHRSGYRSTATVSAATAAVQMTDANGNGIDDTQEMLPWNSDVNGDGLPDAVGFAKNGVQVSLRSKNGLGSTKTWVSGFGAGGRVITHHTRDYNRI